MTKAQVLDIVKSKKLFTGLEVVFATSDGTTFYEYSFAKRHAEKFGLEVFEFKKPKKRVKNGTK
jgi:hypothetical protein